jgi:putative ABC transport system substrate-binding protein
VTRRAFFLSILALLGAPASAAPQPPAKGPRIGVLDSWPPSAFPRRRAAFEQALRQLGHLAGPAALEYRSAHGRVSDLPSLAADLVGLNVDVIFAPTTPAALAARNATRAIPIVMAVVADPIGVKLIESLARPGGNVTGLTTSNVEIAPKRLELLKEICGGRVSRVAYLFNPEDPSNVLSLRSTQEAARGLGLELRPFAAKAPEEIDRAFTAIVANKVEAMVVAAGALQDSHARRIAELAARARVPALYGAAEFVEAGGLASYSADFADNFRRAAAYVDRILRGAKPADLPVEQASRFELVINLKAAGALGLVVPPALTLRADRVIE